MLILASASPRRRELLQNAGIAFSVQPANIPEEPRAGEAPRHLAERLAREKAVAVFLPKSGNVILGADTIVVLDGQILGKPNDNQDAARMLRLLSGRQHEVITAVCLVGDSVPPDVRSASTLVTMDQFSDPEIQQYVSTGEPADKAGGYAIQGIASRWISNLQGDYSNVVGLPVALVWKMLRQHGIV